MQVSQVLVKMELKDLMQITVTPQDSNNDPFDSEITFELFLMYNFAVYVYFHNIQYYYENLSNSIIKMHNFKNGPKMPKWHLVFLVANCA